jgi:Domain of unknown function (DUF1707)
MTGPAGESAARQGRFRASHADREQVVGALQAAFVQGRLTTDELGERVGQALAARTYADLAALTTDLPAGPDRAPVPVPTPPPAPTPTPTPVPVRRPRSPAASFAVKAGTSAIAVTVIAALAAAVISGAPVAAVFIAVFMLVLAAAATAVVASLIHVALKLESRQRSRPRGQRPPGPETGHSAPHVQAPGPDPVRRPDGLLATGLAG